MAYRQLRAVTFAALGLVTVACGGGTSSSSASPDATEQEPPFNSDRPPNDTDTTSNPDRAPTSSETPPTSADDPAGSGGGGRLVGLCQEFCSSLASFANDCNRGMTDVGMDDVCSSADACQVPPNIPCENEIADLFECVIDNLSVLCTATDQGNGNDGEAALPPQTTPCQDVVSHFTACAEANGLNDDDDQTTRGCFAAGGCECEDDCTRCTCEANGDAEEGAACFDVGAACDLARP